MAGIFLFPSASKAVLGTDYLTFYPTVLLGPFPTDKAAKTEANHSATSTAGVKKGCLITGKTLLFRIQVFWNVTMRRLVSSTFETSGNTHLMTQRYTPERTLYYTAMKTHIGTSFVYNI
jgi:hypothetical protein